MVRSAGTWWVSDEEMDGERDAAFASLLNRGLITLASTDSGRGYLVSATADGLDVIGANDHRAAEI